MTVQQSNRRGNLCVEVLFAKALAIQLNKISTLFQQFKKLGLQSTSPF